MQFKLILFFLIIFTFGVLKAEDLKDVLRDAYNFFPDIEKSKVDFQNARKDLQISKTDFLPSLEFSASQGRNLSKSFPDTSKHNFTGVNPTSFDVDITQPLSFTPDPAREPSWVFNLLAPLLRPLSAFPIHCVDLAVPFAFFST